MNFKVCVRCITYNHSKYIVDAMNGFVKQQTNFPYVCCIIDDASPDGEQEIITQYVSDNFIVNSESHYLKKDVGDALVSYVQHTLNKNCFFVVVLLKENYYQQGKGTMPFIKDWCDASEYYALCEGDDYWISPDKLQKQIDILDTNPNCTLTYHASKVIYDDEYETAIHNTDRFSDVKEQYSFKDVVLSYPFQTASVVYRKHITECEIYQRACETKFTLSKMLFIAAADCGEVLGFNETMSVYRKHTGGMSDMIETGENATRKINTYHYISLILPYWKKKCINQYLSGRIWDAYIMTPYPDFYTTKLIIKTLYATPLIALRLLLRQVRYILKRK